MNIWTGESNKAQRVAGDLLNSREGERERERQRDRERERQREREGAHSHFPAINNSGSSLPISTDSVFPNGCWLWVAYGSDLALVWAGTASKAAAVFVRRRGGRVFGLSEEEGARRECVYTRRHVCLTPAHTLPAPAC